MDFLTYNVSRKLPVDVLFLDFAKAFDKVPHRRLLQKLESYGIEGNVLNWIKAFLSNRSQRVILGNTSSTWVNLPEHINSENLCKMYADCTKILSVVKTTEDKARLQSDIESVVTWTRTWLMELNIKKCNVMHFSKYYVSPHNYLMNEYDANGSVTRTVIESSTSEKDLDVQISNDLK
ncbi:uncharacterized protein LOC124813726 [Hydra vulgaris]|uniref:uncharacterized protein LOC124813726 n=1 Tax=Hydra vulgaris TaxID=6087 RepID=UPI001F5F1CB2|nr:uncharacterized protein LOC124813726 [Hydra vulgaris]